MYQGAAVRWEEVDNVLEEFVWSSSRLRECVLKLVQCLILQDFVFHLQQKHAMHKSFSRATQN